MAAEEAIDHNALNAELFTRRIELKKEISELGEIKTRKQANFERTLKRELDSVDARLIDLNYGLVRSYVKRFTSTSSAEDSRDFEGAAVVGLMRAISSFDPSRGKFSTWAYKPIQREVLKAVRDADYPNMNPGDFEKRPDILKAKAELQGGDDNYEPSLEEIAVLAHTTVEQVKRVLDAPMLESIHKTVSQENDTQLGDLIEDTDKALEDSVLSKLDVETLQRYGLSALDEKELFVIVRRYGLDGEPEQGLTTIGEALDLSREAVRQRQVRALSKLNHPIVLRKLVRHGRS